MKIIAILLLLLISTVPTLSQSISTDANGKSVLLGGKGGTAGLDLQRGVFNVNYCFIPKSLLQSTNPLFGLSYTGSNRGGMTDLIQRGSTSINTNLRLYIGFTTSNAIGARYKDPEGFRNRLTAKLKELDSLIKQIKTDSSHILAAKQTFSSLYGSFTDEIIKAYKKYYPNPKEIEKEIWKIYKTSKERDNLSLYYDIRTYIKEHVNAPLISLKQYETEKTLIKEQLSSPSAYFRHYSETAIFFSGGLNSFRFTTVNRLTNNAIITNGINKNHFAGMLGINHRLGRNWFLGYGFGFEVHDNFEALQKANYDTLTVTQNGVKSFSNTIFGYSGNYTTIGSTPFLFQASFITHFKEIGKVIYTPLYFSLGKRRQYGTSASIVFKNNLSFGISIEELILTNELAPRGAERYLSFGFHLRYILNDFDID